MPTNQKFVVKVDSRGLMMKSLEFIGSESDCQSFVIKHNNIARQIGAYYTFKVCNFVVGRGIYIDGTFAGEFVENLTDYIDESPEWRQTQLANGPIGEYKFEGINCLPYKIYGRRKVFSIEFGSVNQILTRNLTNDDLVWVNI